MRFDVCLLGLGPAVYECVCVWFDGLNLRALSGFDGLNLLFLTLVGWFDDWSTIHWLRKARVALEIRMDMRLSIS